ncbi:MAG: aldehyde dehydrogenase family protein [Chloroflexi bacterium]|nr:aldehyde dehydrogenase family protein [Chloroflexota bacterium]
MAEAIIPTSIRPKTNLSRLPIRRIVAPPSRLRSAGRAAGGRCHNAPVSESAKLRPWSGDRAPADWGLGDGQAIPWEYAPAPESRDIVTLKSRYGLFIDGREVAAQGGAVFESVNPATEEVLAEVAKASPADVDKAIRAAGRAQKTRWGNLPGRERAKYLFRIARILQERAREFAVLESMDSGKPIKESRDVDVPLVAAHFWYYAGWADKLEYAFPGRVAKPLGVAAQVIPWNFPLLMLAWKIAPALAAGNTVVLKPASTTPLSALLFAEVCRQADLPPGVVNIVPGPAAIGMHLVSHPGVDKVAFTGSTEVGKLIHKATAGTDKAITLELGGKAANIVFEDAALDQAVEGIVNGIYFNQGEVCCAGSRLLVQESVQGPLIEKLKDRLSTIRVGDPLDKNTDVGAINSKAQLEKITELVASGVEEGAEIYQPACDLPDRGWFFRPTLFTNVAQSHRIAKEEIFGPVLSVLTFRTPDEAVEKANNTPYGLSAGIWTEKGSRILWMVRQMRAGVVWANTFNRFDPTSPFGGYKESGFGREGGMHGLHAYVRLERR